MTEGPVVLPFRRARVLAGVSASTLRRWTREGKLPDRRSSGGQRVFLADELGAVVGHPLTARAAPGGGTVVAYARVSSRRQAAEGDLERQVERLRMFASTERDGVVIEVYTDVASGLSDNRAGLRRVLARCQAQEVTELVVTHRERLARFGTKSIETLLTGFSVALTVVGEDAELSASAESELVRDMLAVVTSFSGRLYGQRSVRARALRSCVTKAQKA